MLAAVCTLGLASTLLVGATGTATADPTDPPLTVEDAKAQVAELETEAEAIDQRYVAVQDKITAGKAKLVQQQADVKAQTARVAAMRRQVGQVALAQFQNRTLDTTAQLFFTSDTDTFLNQVSTVEKVSQNQNSTLQDFQAQQAQLASLERSAAADLASLQEQQQSLAELRQSSEAKIAESKAVLAKLTEDQRKRIAAEEARQAAAAKQAADKAAGDGSGNTKDRSAGSPAGSSRGARALAFAKAQLGKPYRFAAAGPDAYDCSGLAMAAWRAAGVSLPRTSMAQYGAGRPVSKSDLQPGDLVFFYSGVSHVALYVGHGMVIHAPHPGRSVEYITMSYMPYVGARRPG